MTEKPMNPFATTDFRNAMKEAVEDINRRVANMQKMQSIVSEKGKTMKNEQMTLLADAWKSDGLEKKKKSVKRKWENAFQKWSNEHGIENYGNTEDYGCCGFGSMCDWCKDNSYGRPCVRALNAMCREKHIEIDYADFDFTKIW